MRPKNVSIAIPLAWPQTKCKQAGAWYDGLLQFLRFNRQGYYQVGHAAVVLLNPEHNTFEYYDFGRYHSPHGHGRVRSAHTDHDLIIKTKPVFNDGRVVNIDQLLLELYRNPSAHGDGPIYGKPVKINYLKAKQLVDTLGEQAYLPYGPFVWQGTNCSRFVNSTMIEGAQSWLTRLVLRLPWTVSPAPLQILQYCPGDMMSYGLVGTQEAVYQSGMELSPIRE
ncbi:MAG: hypothetical protein OCD76_03720 [Reichenbachiella sp.]